MYALYRNYYLSYLLDYLNHIFIAQNMIFSTPLRLVLGTSTPHKRVRKLGNDTFMKSITKFLNCRFGWMQYYSRSERKSEVNICLV